jgi:hypothetical protein
MLLRAVIVAGVLVFAGLFAASLVGLGGVAQCDGTVPRWMLPDDYDGGGCIEGRPPWEALLPWNLGEWEPYCLGMCQDESLLPGRLTTMTDPAITWSSRA